MGKKIQCIGRYVMEGVALGKGTFARVELAAHEVTAIKVAVKVIDTRKIKEEYIRQNLYREARIMAHLRHPNIIRLYETLRATTLYCLVTEYAAGGELLAHIKSQEGSRLTESAARPFIRQLVSALHYIHERNVVHRIVLTSEQLTVYKDIFAQEYQKDGSASWIVWCAGTVVQLSYMVGQRSFRQDSLRLSPGMTTQLLPKRDLKMENIMLDEKKKNIKLIDFGLSAVWKEADPLKTHCGSPEYAAPELFVIGKLYGAEIDIWSFGIITYAMTIGKLPFSTPFRDEYQRQRMLQQIQKGLSSYHDREMQILTPDCRNLLHQLIEPNPELRIPLSEVEKHPWLTRNGKYPFCPFHPLPKDKLLHHQAVAELAFMRGLKRNKVEEEVRDHRGNDLSAMYNMIMDEKKKKSGFFDHDHTTKKVPRRDRESRSRSRERDKIRTPESGRGKDIRTKSGAVKKVPNKSTAGKAGAGSKAKPKNLRHSSMTSQRDGKSVTVSGAQIIIDSEMAPEPPALSSPKHKPAIHTPGGNSINSFTKQKDTPTANGPTRIPLSQRRQPPPKLNLTLDLSIPHSLPIASSAVSKKPLCLTSSVESTRNAQQGRTGMSSRQGIEASSGVPPRLSPQTTSKIPVASPTKPHTSLMGRLERHLPAPCRPSSFQHTLRSPWHKPTPLQSPAREPSDTTGASEKEDSLMQAEKLVAPKATPEDSLIDSYSTSSEEDRNQLCQLLEEREDFDVEGYGQESMQTTVLNNLATYVEGDPVHSDRTQEHDLPDISATGSDVSKGTLVRENPSHDAELLPRKPPSPRKLLLQNLSASEHFESGSSQFSQSSNSGSHLVHYTGSGSSLPANFQQQHSAKAERTDSLVLPPKSVCLLEETRSDSAPADGLLSSHKNHPSLFLTLSTSDKLLPPQQPHCQGCGVSPSSPTYMDRHSKFCHTGAHALDVFFSPDEVPSPTGVLWRPVASTIQDSPTRGGSDNNPGDSGSPLFGSPIATKALRVPMQMAVASAESFSDDEYEEEELDTSHHQPLLPQTHKCQSPTTHIPTAKTIPIPSTANNAKRTAPSKLKSKSANPSSSKSKRLSKNGIYSAIPDTSIRLDTTGGEVLTSSSSSSLLHTETDAQGNCSSAEKLATSSCNAAKVHPLEKPKEEGKSFRSRIPRPSSSRFGRLQVLSLLHPEKNKDKCKQNSDSQNSSPKSTPEKKSDTDRLLRQYDPKSKQYSWRQGLSHLLRIHRSTTNSNNNMAPARKKGSNSRSKPTANSSNTGNSLQGKLSTAENNSNHGTPNKSRKNSKDPYYQEMDSKWTAPPSPIKKCNSLKVTSSTVPSSCPSQNAPLYDKTSSIPDCLHRGAKPRRVGWTGCKECAKSDHSSDEGVEITSIPLEEKISDNSKEAMLPTSNNIQQMTSHV